MNALSLPEINQALIRLRRKLCCLAANSSQIVNINSNSPDTLQGNTIQILNNGDVYVVNEDGVATRVDFELTENEVQRASNGEVVIYHDLENGGITDAILSVTKNGAMTTATIDKVGDFDRIAVTAGAGNTSYILFPAKYIIDEGAIYRASVKISALNSDGITGTSHIGIGKHGAQTTQDTGSIFPGIAVVELIGKTAIRYGLGTAAMTVTTSGGTLVSNGDIIDMVQWNDLSAGKMKVRVTNQNTGEWLYAESISENPTNLGMISGVIRIALTNVTAILLDVTVSSAVPSNPLIQLLGDSYAIGLGQAFTGTLQPKFSLLTPRNMVVSAGNGGYIYTIAKRQMQEVIKMKPKYILIFTILSLFYGDFILADPDNANFMIQWNSLMTNTVRAGIVPIHIKWPVGPFGGAHETQWNTFLNAQLITYPTMKILDLSAETLAFSDGSHPSPADFTIITNRLITLLESLGF